MTLRIWGRVQRILCQQLTLKALLQVYIEKNVFLNDYKFVQRHGGTHFKDLVMV